MYSRPQNKDFRVPHNYSGSIFGSRQAPSTPIEDLTHRRTAPPSEQVREQIGECPCDDRECCSPQEAASEVPKSTSLFSPFGALGSEELLLIALALIVFQGGKEPELALILLALLFIA